MANRSLLEPCESNQYFQEQAEIILNSLFQLTEKALCPENLTGVDRARWLFEAPFVIVSHGTEADPVFNYANKTALKLFEMTWTEFTNLPSRFSAEPLLREERARLMAEVQANGFITNYGGIRISKSGRRFRIESALVWNLIDSDDTIAGQAAMFETWTDL